MFSTFHNSRAMSHIIFLNECWELYHFSFELVTTLYAGGWGFKEGENELNILSSPFQNLSARFDC